MKRFIAWVFAVSGAIGIVHCSSSTDSSANGNGVCQIGRQLECACVGGEKGYQVCQGSTFGPCICGDASLDSGGSDGSDGSGGSSGSAGSAGSGGSGGASGSAGSAGSSTGGNSGASGSGGNAGSSTGGSAGSAGATDGGVCPAGEATNILTGACDVVLQNCGTGLTCTVQQQGDSGTWATACITLGTGSKQLAERCSSHSECEPGLRCTLGKCTRPCCDSQVAAICGATGACDMKINYASGAAFLQVCTFAPPCTPWANDCPGGGAETDCHLGSGNKLGCSFPNYAADAGSTLDQPCTYINDCEDSQYCYYAASATTGTCRWLCKLNTAGTPDAGTVGGAPGQGGCLSGQTCTAFQSPAWLGFCN